MELNLISIYLPSSQPKNLAEMLSNILEREYELDQDQQSLILNLGSCRFKIFSSTEIAQPQPVDIVLSSFEQFDQIAQKLEFFNHRHSFDFPLTYRKISAEEGRVCDLDGRHWNFSLKTDRSSIDSL